MAVTIVASEAMPIADVHQAARELDPKHDQDLRDTCVMLLDRAGCDLLTICDITGHSYRSAQTIVKHHPARNVGRTDAGIDRLELHGVRRCRCRSGRRESCISYAWSDPVSSMGRSVRQ
jgi:hypothetical protein